MSQVCKRGYKCMCFQCAEKDCEHFESEPPEWVKDFFENEEIKEKLKELVKGAMDDQRRSDKRVES